jgi:putative hydrolase of HD superfamily
MTSSILNDVLQFTTLLNKFQEIERVIYLPGRDRRENDEEHSYQLAMLAWYIVERGAFDLNRDLVVKYALIHDLVEVYAGDTYIYSKNHNDHESKQEREERARIRIEEEFKEFGDLHTMIQNYEKREDKESCFVYVLDKIHPVLQLYLDNGRGWKEEKVTLKMLFDKKKDKISLAEELRPLWNELEELLIENESELFPQDQKLPL